MRLSEYLVRQLDMKCFYFQDIAYQIFLCPAKATLKKVQNNQMRDFKHYDVRTRLDENNE